MDEMGPRGTLEALKLASCFILNVPPNGPALAALDTWAARFSNRMPQAFVFPSCENGKIRLDRPIANWRTAWRRICKAAGCRDFASTTCVTVSQRSCWRMRYHMQQGLKFSVGPRRLPYGWRSDTVTSVRKRNGGRWMPLRRSVFQQVCTKLSTKWAV